MLKTEGLRGTIFAAMMAVPSLSCKDEMSWLKQVPPTPSPCVEVLNQHFDSNRGRTLLWLICREYDGKTGYYSWNPKDRNQLQPWQRNYEMQKK